MHESLNFPEESLLVNSKPVCMYVCMFSGVRLLKLFGPLKRAYCRLSGNIGASVHRQRMMGRSSYIYLYNYTYRYVNMYSKYHSSQS